jgi:hypothetical protein
MIFSVAGGLLVFAGFFFYACWDAFRWRDWKPFRIKLMAGLSFTAAAGAVC